MAKHDNTDFLRFGDKYLVVDHIVRWESRAHPSGNYVIIGTVGGFESELKDTNGTVLKALVEEFTYPNEPTTMSYYDESGTIDRSAFEAAAKDQFAPPPKGEPDPAACDCPGCVQDRIEEAFQKDIGSVGKSDYELMVKVNDGRPLTESDAKWWIDLGSEGRAHARKSLVELANAPKGERGPILAKLMLDTLFGDIAEHRSNSIDSMIADIFGSKAPKLTISLEPGPFDQEALESAFRSMNDVTLAFHDSQMHRAYYSTDAHRSGKFILDWIRIGRAERMEQRLHIMRELRLGNGQGSLPTT